MRAGSRLKTRVLVSVVSRVSTASMSCTGDMSETSIELLSHLETAELPLTCDVLLGE